MYIGIHVNTLPTTVFINRLLEALVKRGHKVVVFGTAVGKFNKIGGVKYVCYSLYSFLNLSKISFFFKYNLLLSVFRPKQKGQLNAILVSDKKANSHHKTQFYPILWHKPEVLHVQWVKGIEQFLWVQDFGVKLATSLRGSHIYLTPLIEVDTANSYLKSFPKLDGIHAVCQDLIDEAKAFSIPTNKAKVIYSGLEVEDFPFTKPSEKKRKNKKSITIISGGRASWMKGFDVAIDAMDILKSRNIEVEYKIIGAGNSEELTFQVHDLKLQNYVELMPWQSIDQVKKSIQEADILLVSSVSEGIANTAIEAMALGTLVISTNCGGMQELVIHGENGFVVPMRSPSAIAEIIEQVYALPIESLDSIALKARKKIEEEFDMGKNIQSFETFYQTCLNG